MQVIQKALPHNQQYALAALRLFLFTSFHEQRQLLDGRLPDGFTEHLIEQVS